jgi:hypothetical protein
MSTARKYTPSPETERQRTVWQSSKRLRAATLSFGGVKEAKGAAAHANPDLPELPSGCASGATPLADIDKADTVAAAKRGQPGHAPQVGANCAVGGRGVEGIPCVVPQEDIIVRMRRARHPRHVRGGH